MRSATNLGGMSADARDDHLSDLADAVLTLAREIELRLAEDPEIIRLPGTARMVLRYVHHHPGVSPSEIGERLGVKRPNVSDALRLLEGLGLVDRARPHDDGRGVVVSVTSRAEANLARMRRIWARTLGSAVPADADVDRIAAALGRMAEDLTDARGEDAGSGPRSG